MTKRALVLAPILFVVLALAHSFEWAISGAVGVAMTLANLWLAARVIGGVADNNPQLLLPAALAAFAFGLALLTGVTFALRTTGLVYFPVTGFTLIGTHFVLVLWEAAGAYGKSGNTADARS
jgi:hypothetical protein